MLHRFDSEVPVRYSTTSANTQGNPLKSLILRSEMAIDETKCLFVSDLHGRCSRYEKLFARVRESTPEALFLGGDVLPHALEEDFLDDYLIPQFTALKRDMEGQYPSVFVILGNDDPRSFESRVKDAEDSRLWRYVNNRKEVFNDYTIYGYCYVPPTPFRLKDWERYDVSRYCDPGCISPEEGLRTFEVDELEIKWGTIEQDLARLTGYDSLERSIFLFHSPPYDTVLDRAALDGKTFDHVPLDSHVGSIAIRRFIEQREPALTLHGHVHESARLTGEWKTQVGKTVCITAADDAPELALVEFDPRTPEGATRQLL